MRIAVIGGGISGSLVARLLHSQHEVVLFEAADYLGGHANTVQAEIGGRLVSADTGFMVFNDRTYPNFCRMLDLLGVSSQKSDMSFSVSCKRTALEYQGSSINGLFAQRSNLFKPSFYRMLLDIVRFNKLGTRAAEEYRNSCEPRDDALTVGQFLADGRFGSNFILRYLVPMSAAIWSCEPSAVFDFPARFLLGFFHNHGLMQLADRPQWKTIVGGSQNYVKTLLGPLQQGIRLSCPVARVFREPSAVRVVSVEGEELFDQVVFATHADQSLTILGDATADESRVLEQFPYQANQAVLHTDESLLPARTAAWASWNYRIPKLMNSAATLTYDLNRLQNLGLSQPLLLTLNETESINPDKILRSFVYHHPAYRVSSIGAQAEHARISGLRQRTHYCGAYWGYGFHEDGVNSALAVTAEFGIGLESCTVVSSKAPLATVDLSR
jgi:predicted NAD/FAD-binding protein